MRNILTYIFLFTCHSVVFAQQKYGTISGKIVNDDDFPLQGVEVRLLTKNSGVQTNASGIFSIKVPAQKPIALIIKYKNLQEVQRNFNLLPNENEFIQIKLENKYNELDEVEVSDNRTRLEVGLTKIESSKALSLPSVSGGVEGLIKILTGTNNELTNQYNVRGGSFDENLLYINDFEIFRPYLVRNGQQEGLSFINPQLTKNINFYNGGFSARYGDKMSSVLDIQYKTPKKFEASTYISFLEQGLHFEGINRKKNFTYLVGLRNRDNRGLLKSQETVGAYIPISNDIQALLSYKYNDKLNFDFLINNSKTSFDFSPITAQKTINVFSPLYTQQLALDIEFAGREVDKYTTKFYGLSSTYKLNEKAKIKFLANYFENNEFENFDITGEYLFGERDFDKSSASFGQIVNALGAGRYQNYARNKLNIKQVSTAVKYFTSVNKHAIEAGLNFDVTKINDQLAEWELQDSAGYSLPYVPGTLSLGNVFNSNAQLNILKTHGYLQDNIKINDQLYAQMGCRFNYNQLNNEFIVTPRASISYWPVGKKNIIYKSSLGLYHQPPFYREIRNYKGQINKNVLSQKSAQVTVGVDYNINTKSKKKLRLTVDGYYKHLYDLVTYDIDNVKIRYAGNNNAVGYAVGVETRLYGEIVKDAESWLSIGFMRTNENLKNDFYYLYKNAAGEIITPQTTDRIVKDSVKKEVGFVRRPTDRLLTVGAYVEDYLSTNKNIKIYFSFIYGSDMPYNILNSVRYRNALTIPSYIRADAGFSFQLVSPTSKIGSKSPFRVFSNLWANLEVFNLIDRSNTISYQQVKDFSNNIFMVPNRLTPRILNLKLFGKF